MNISVSQPNLAQALSAVSHAVTGKSSIMILSNILLTTEENCLCLSATNLEVGIRFRIPAMIEEEGTITVPARLFTDLVNTMPPDTVNMKVDISNQTMTVRCRQLVTEIHCLEADDYPPFPEFNEADAISFEMPDLKKMINQVAFAASTEDSRPVLHGVKLSVEGEELSMAATDGYRIAVKKIKLLNGLDRPVSAIIPAVALRELARLAGPNDKTVLMVFCEKDSNRVIFHLENAELISQLIAGQFIDVESLVPKSYKTTIIVSRTALQAACNSAGVFARESKNLIKLDVQEESENMGSISITTTAESIGNSLNRVECSLSGAPIVIAFNVNYLRNVLDVLESPNIMIRTNSSMAPALIEPSDVEEDYRYIIMPMHFSAE